MNRKVLALAALIISASGLAVAAEREAGPKPKEITKEERAKMADAHEKMAACLRSDRPFMDCHKEMWEAHKGMMGGKGECPMHGGKGHHHKHDSDDKNEGKDEAK
jgi:hypothetical protein